MQFLSYNLLKHRAVHELEALIENHTPSVLCLQEVNVQSMPKQLGNLEMAIGTEKNRLGLAVYLDTSRYTVEETASFKLKDAHYDRLAAPAHERLLGVRARSLNTGKLFTVGSFHASPLTALNAIRRAQIKDGLERLDLLGEGSPLMMLGDFNYPIFRRRLEREVTEAGYQLLTSDERTYRNYRVVRGFFDFGVSRGFGETTLRTLAQGASDHLPILAKVANAL